MPQGYSRVYNAILYPEDNSQQKAIELLKTNAFSSAGILHDKDLDDNGNVKKPHYHFVLKFQNARSRKAVADDLSVAENYFEPSHNFNSSLLYLVHRNSPDKYQYSIDDVFGSLKPTLEKLLDDDTEDMKAIRILDMLDSIESRIDFRTFLRLCAEKGLWSDLRRGGYLFVQAVKEHNERYYD